MLNRSASVLEVLPGKLNIKRHLPCIFYLISDMIIYVHTVVVKKRLYELISSGIISLLIEE